MTVFKTQRIRNSIALAFVMASCVHSTRPALPPAYTLKLSEQASGPLGKAPLTVVAAGPRGVIAKGEEPGVTLVFNRAMRLVDAPLDSGLPGAQVRTAEGETVPGAFRFVGTRGILFNSARPLPGATRFRVTVPRGTKSIDGSTLGEEYSYEFATDVLALVASYPSARPLRENEPIYLQFSQAIAPAELARFLEFNQEIPGEKQPRAVAFRVEQAAPDWLFARTNTDDIDLEQRARWTSSANDRWLKVVPNASLPLNRQFNLVLKPGLRSLEGPLPTTEKSTLSLRSFGPLVATNFKCARLNLGRCQAHRDFTAEFSNPIHPDEFRRYLRIDGPARRAKPTSGARPIPKKVAFEHALGLDPDFGDHFRVTLLKGLSDVYGQKLQADVSFDLQIEEPFVKSVELPKPVTNQAACESAYESESDDRGAAPSPKRPRLQYDLTLGVTGHIVEARAAGANPGGGLPRIPISSINVPTYGLSTEKLTEFSTVKWLNDRTPLHPYRSFQWISANAPKNTRAVRPLDLGASLAHDRIGTALVSLIGAGQLQSQDTLLNVTDLAISAKMSKLGSLVWVTRLSTGKAVPAATVTAYGPGADAVGQAVTDDQGLASFSFEQLKPISQYGSLDESILLVARANDDFTYQRLESARGAMPPSGVDFAQKSNWVGLVFTDRSVYRPGETVKAGGFFRRTAELGFTVTPNAPFQYKVRDSAWETVAIGESRLDAQGALAQDIVLGKSAAFGRATLTVQFGRQSDEAFDVPFEILAYRPAEFKVSVDSTARDVVHRRTATFKISAEYLYGSKLGEAKVNAHISRNEVNFEPPQSKGYRVDDSAFLSDLRFTTKRGSAYLHDTKSLDASGELSMTIPLDAPEQSKPELLTLEAEVTDLSAQTQSARAAVMVHPAEYYIGVKPPKTRFLATGALAPIEIAAFSPQGQRASSIPVNVELFRRTWLSALEDRPSDVLHHRTMVRDDRVGQCTVLTEKSAADCALRLTEPGYYLLRASAQDTLGNRVYASYGVYAVNDRADRAVSSIQWGRAERRGLDLELDQTKYLPGDLAKVLIKSPFQEATALVTVERGGILSKQVVPVRGKMAVIDVPVLESFFPNAFVSVHLVRGRIAKMPDLGQADVGAPDYRIGYTELFVDPESRRLNIEIKTPKQQYFPGDEVEAELKLHSKEKGSLPGTVTFYVVDEGVLRLTGYKTPDPLPAFAGSRRLGVAALESRDGLARILNYKDGERISTLGFETPDDAGNDKGYEGGGGDELPGKLRSDFRTTVYFKAGQSVGSDGKTRFRFNLPDNLTSYRLMAIAVAESDRFGFGESSILAHRPLMARPALPRRLRVGDQLEASVVVSSKGIGATLADVTVKAEGARVLGASTARVALAANGQAKVSFPVSVERDGKVAFEFGARAGQHADRVLLRREAEQPIRWLTASTFGTAEKSLAVGLGDLRGYETSRGELNVQVSNSALIGLKPVFDSLASYPYGCTEQLTSRVLPLLLAPKLAELEQVRLPTERDGIDSILGEIVKRVKDNGSLFFWEGDRETSAWLTAYALLALEEGNKAQYFVPKATRDRVSKYLTQTLDAYLASELTWSQGEDGINSEENGDSSERPANLTLSGFESKQHSPTELKRLRLAQSVFIADMLARTGQLDESRLRRLMARRQEMALSSKIQLLRSMASLRLPRQELERWLQPIVEHTTIGLGEARVERHDPVLSELLESDTRSTAWLLEAVLAIDLKHALAPKLTRGLLRNKTAASFRNTQDEAWVLLALEKYRNAEALTPIDMDVEVLLGERSQGSFGFRDLRPKAEFVKIAAKTLLESANSNLSFHLDGKGKVNYAVQLKLAKQGASEQALDEGLSVEKLQRPVDSANLANIAKTIAVRNDPTAKLGQLVLVDILLETAEPRDRLVIDDPMPAGFEPVEFAFATTTQALAFAENAAASTKDQRTPKESRYGALRSMVGVHREMHDDRVIYYIPHVEPGIFHFRYLARATSAGRFVVPPTRAACMYDPDVFGQTKATRFEITSKN